MKTPPASPSEENISLILITVTYISRFGTATYLDEDRSAFLRLLTLQQLQKFLFPELETRSPVHHSPGAQGLSRAIHRPKKKRRTQTKRGNPREERKRACRRSVMGSVRIPGFDFAHDQIPNKSTRIDNTARGGRMDIGDLFPVVGFVFDGMRRVETSTICCCCCARAVETNATFQRAVATRDA